MSTVPKYVNLTPHAIKLYRLGSGADDIPFAEIPAAGAAARVAEVDAEVSKEWLSTDLVYRGPDGQVGWWPEENYQLAVPVVLRSYAAILDLPEPVENTLYIVSLPVLQALGGTRGDVVCPDSGPGRWGAVRDEKGQILGVRRFVTTSPFYKSRYGGPWPVQEWEAANV